MYVFLTTIGEKTTDLAEWQCKRLGFDVIKLDKKEDWIDKYKKFIYMAKGNCLRCNADIILNQNAKQIKNYEYYLMVQYRVFDFYTNDIKIGQPVWYSKEALEIIRDNLNNLDEFKPETSAWRLPDINSLTVTEDLIVGSHGFYQRKQDIYRHIDHRIRKNQKYDIDLIERIINET